MAYYYGKFRNIDTSVDPLGQEYKVVIFTNYDGSVSPYTFNPISEEPNLGTELTMTTTPFVVSYQNEDGNIYKPYKCSTATVSFLMSTLNLDLFTNKENNILVALLKRDNDIIRRGDTYINKYTEEVVIRKKAYGLFYGFLPSELDSKCYKVEWIGFATPNTYNQNYTLVEQEFQLECQDAFSTLKYDGLPFNNLVEVRDVKTIINLIIGQLGTYKHIYYPSNLSLIDSSDGTSFRKIIQQYRNFIDKEDEPVSKIELIEAIGTFLNVSFIPFKDSVYIVNYEGVAGNINYFYHYTLINNNNLFFNYRTENPTWSDSVLETLENNLELNKDCYASDDTNITMQSVYSNFRVKCDENEVDLMPDLGDSKNFSVLRNNGSQVGYLYTETLSSFSTTYYESAKWNGGVIGTLQQPNGVGFKSYIYRASYLIDDVPLDNYISVNPELNTSIFNINPDNSYNPNYYTGCVVLKNTKIIGSESKNTNWFSSKTDTNFYNESYSNDIVFWGKNNFGHTPSRSNYNSWWDNNSQMVLAYNSPKIVCRRNKNLCIKGDWTFFRNNAFISLPINDNQRVGWGTDGLDSTVDRTKLYITTQILIRVSDGVIDNYYFVRKNADDTFFLNHFAGVGIQYRVDLPLEDNDYDKNKPFGQVFSFKNNIGENSGLCIPLDTLFPEDSELIMDIQFKIMKPLGVAIDSNNYPVFCNSAILRNFEISLVDADLIESWGYGDITTDFHNKLNKNLDTFEVDNKLSTNQYINKLSYNYAFRVNDNHYFLLEDLYNQATGIIGRPEILKLADIYNQYRDKTIGLNTTLWENLGITPNTRVKWNNRNFIIDKQEIDYELNRNTVSIIEKKLRSDIPEIETKMYLENENGQTLNLNPFYNEIFNPITVDSYNRSGTAVIGESNNQINAAISFYPTWSYGIEAWVSIPEILLDDVNVSINNNGELIIYAV